jgi:hypothetical protein
MLPDINVPEDNGFIAFLAAEFAADAHSPMNGLYRGRIEMW